MFMLNEYAIAILATISLVAGLLGSLLGLGGGFIIVPALSFFNIPPSQIASTSLFSVLSTSASSSIAYAKQGRIDYSLAIRLAILAIPGSILGAYVSGFIESNEFRIYFAIILLATSLYMFKRNSIARRDINSNLVMVIAYLASFLAGFISSLFGIGGGVIYMPLMIGLLAIKAKQATATSQFILFISSISGLLTHSYLGHPDYILALILIVGTFIGAQIGARISLLIREKLLRVMVSIALIIIAIKLVIDSL